ncbi:MAG: hypothetical protein GY705_05595 [Bacteroidetes bacterium]|nr:hypothetical protein [Bacteroidota bacterium]
MTINFFILNDFYCFLQVIFRNGALINCAFIRRYFYFIQGEKHERAILKGECPVDIQVREPLADVQPGHRRGFST